MGLNGGPPESLKQQGTAPLAPKHSVASSVPDLPISLLDGDLVLSKHINIHQKNIRERKKKEEGKDRKERGEEEGSPGVPAIP